MDRNKFHTCVWNKNIPLTLEYRHGLSYSAFEYSNLRINGACATLDVTDSGETARAEIVQLYISVDQATCSIARPLKELKGFEKVYLQPKETESVKIPFARLTTAFWEQVLEKWVCEKGKYEVLIGSSSQDIRLESVLELDQTTAWSGL